MTTERGNDAKRRSAVRPLSVEAVEFSPALMPEQNLKSGRKTMSSGAGGVVPAVVSHPPVPAAAGLPNEGPAALPEYLEEIVGGSHPSLGGAGRQRLRDLIFRYRHVFPASGEPVTGRTTTVQHDIITTDARPVRCGPRRLAPAGLRKEQTCVQEILDGGQIEPSDSPWASPVVLVTKKDRTTWFCVDYRRLNARRTLIPCPGLMIHYVYWETNSGFPQWTSQVDIGRLPCRRRLNARLCL